MTEPKQRRSASVIFSHLSEEERIDKACELLAIGVLRLAEKRRPTSPVILSEAKDLKVVDSSAFGLRMTVATTRDDNSIALHQNKDVEEKILKPEAVL